jgi:hypothetical protein
MLRVRAKISFMAFEKGITIQEIFLHAIWTSYMTFLHEGLVLPERTTVEADELFKQIIMG